MAAGLFEALADPAKARALSAGTEPGERVHPEVVEVMRERGVDLSGKRPRRLTPELAAEARVLVTMGCGDACPFVPGAEVLDWPLEDPRGRSLAEVRNIRDAIEQRVRALVSERGWQRPDRGGTP